jgi:O-antigen/teichoic acid export membrane protein
VVWTKLIQQAFLGVAQAYHSYRLINLIGTIQAVLINIGMIVIASNGGRSVELMKWQVVASIVFLLVYTYCVSGLTRNIDLSFSWESKKFVKIFKYSFSTWMSSLGGVLFGQVDRLIVGALLGAESLGIYAAITNVTVQINTLSALPVQPLLPMLSALSTPLDKPEFDVGVVLRKALEVNSVVALGMGILLITFDFFIVSLFLDSKAASSYINEFRGAAIIYTIYSMNAVGYYITFASNAAGLCMVVQIVSGIASLIFIYVGIKVVGLPGAIIGNFGYCMVWLLTFLGFRRLNISFLEWASWIIIPVFIFLVFCVSILLSRENIPIKLLAGFFSSALLSIWFISCNIRTLSSQAMRLFRLKRNSDS